MITPLIMKRFKKILPVTMAAIITCISVPAVAYADNAKVVTLGADLTEEQRTSMYEYFGTSSSEVATIEVNNTDERQYMEGIAPEEQIGTRTYSCSYVEPTDSGGIQVKTANLTYVTSSMIASTLLTSGVENCNVVAAAPFAVSGTGALTGIMMAYETASGETLDEGQKEAATQELVTTGQLADSIGEEDATDLINEVKQDVIENDLSDPAEIENAVTDAANDVGITLTDAQIAQITDLMQNIAQYDYDVKALQTTLDTLSGGKDKGFFAGLWDSVKSVFTGGSNDGGIINDTDDSLFGAGTIIDSTLDSFDQSSDDGEGFFDKIVNFFKNLFGGSKSDSDDTDSSFINSIETTDTYEESTDDAETDTIIDDQTDSYTDSDSEYDSVITDDTETDTSSTSDTSDNGLVINTEE